MGKKIAIKGHSTRGNEVIKLLEMMGGHNGSNLLGNKSDYVYFITDSGDIGCRDTNHILIDYFTIEMFLEKYPFKVGDKVFDKVDGDPGIITAMKWDEDVFDMKYCVVFDNGDMGWYTNDTIEFLNLKEGKNMNKKLGKNMNKKLGIKGHPTRGKEIFELMEMMGGNINKKTLSAAIIGDVLNPHVYFFDPDSSDNRIVWNYLLGLEHDGRASEMIIFTLEEFLEKYPFKVGDKVFLYDNITEGCVTGMEWDEDKGTVKYCVYTSAEYWCDVKELLKWNAVFKEHDIVTIVSDNGHSRWICEYKSRKADQLLYYRGTYVVTNNGCKDEDLMYNSNYDIYPEDTIRLATPVEVVLFERLIQKNKKHSVLSELPEHIKTTSKEELEQEFDEMNEIQTKRNTEIEHMLLPNKVDDNLEYNIINGYEFDRVENGKIILKPIKPKYPKTYEECCKVMGVNHTNDLDICEHCDYKTEITYYEDNLLEKIEVLYRLIICRDAYRKIAGEEMGLGKPWEPDFTNDDEERYGIYTAANKVVKDFCGVGDVNMIFTFPTEEMRDTFYENFNKEIEQCKELL